MTSSHRQRLNKHELLFRLSYQNNNNEYNKVKENNIFDDIYKLTASSLGKNQISKEYYSTYKQIPKREITRYSMKTIKDDIFTYMTYDIYDYRILKEYENSKKNKIENIQKMKCFLGKFKKKKEENHFESVSSSRQSHSQNQCQINNNDIDNKKDKSLIIIKSQLINPRQSNKNSDDRFLIRQKKKNDLLILIQGKEINNNEKSSNTQLDKNIGGVLKESKSFLSLSNDYSSERKNLEIYKKLNDITKILND